MIAQIIDLMKFHARLDILDLILLSIIIFNLGRLYHELKYPKQS
jgi:hypothetical protein